MKKIISISGIIFLIVIGCKKETVKIESTLEGNWVTFYEGYRKISTKYPGKVINEYAYPPNEILTIGLEIDKNNMKFIYGINDYAKVKYKILVDSATKINYIYIVNSSEKIQYSLDKDTLSLFGFSSGSYHSTEEPFYNLTETKLFREIRK